MSCSEILLVSLILVHQSLNISFQYYRPPLAASNNTSGAQMIPSGMANAVSGSGMGNATFLAGGYGNRDEISPGGGEFGGD